MITWELLTEAERNDLKAIADGKFHDDQDYLSNEFACYMPLWNKGLIARKYEKTYVTDLGKRVLASATEKPTTITAAEFVRDGYATSIAACKCEVRDHWGDRVLTVQVYEKYDELVDYLVQNHKDDTGNNGDDPTWVLSALDSEANTFSVIWQPQTSATAGKPTAEAAGEADVLIDEPLDNPLRRVGSVMMVDKSTWDLQQARLAAAENEVTRLRAFVQRLAGYKPESNQSEYYDGMDTARDQIADQAKEVLSQAAALATGDRADAPGDGSGSGEG